MKNSLSSLLVSAAIALAPLAAGAQQVLTNVPPPAPIPETQTAAPSPNHAWVPGFWTWSGTQYTWTQGHWEVPQQQGAAWEAPQWENQGGRYRFRPGRWFRRGGGMQVNVGAQPGMPGSVQVNVGAQPGVQPAQGTVWVRPNPPQGQVVAPVMQPGVVVQQPGVVMQQPGVVVQQPGVVVQQPGVVMQQPGVVMQQPGVIRLAPPRARMERRPRVLPNGQLWVPGYWNWDGAQYQWVPGHVEAPPAPSVRWRAPRYLRRGGAWVYTPGGWQ